jgi:hypothetical protein
MLAILAIGCLIPAPPRSPESLLGRSAFARPTDPCSEEISSRKDVVRKQNNHSNKWACCSDSFRFGLEQLLDTVTARRVTVPRSRALNDRPFSAIASVSTTSQVLVFYGSSEKSLANGIHQVLACYGKAPLACGVGRSFQKA